MVDKVQCWWYNYNDLQWSQYWDVSSNDMLFINVQMEGWKQNAPKCHWNRERRSFLHSPLKLFNMYKWWYNLTTCNDVSYMDCWTLITYQGYSELIL